MLKMYLGAASDQFSGTSSYWVTLYGIMHIIIISNPKDSIFGRDVPGWHVYNRYVVRYTTLDLFMKILKFFSELTIIGIIGI